MVVAVPVCPLNNTVIGETKLVPVIVTTVPTPPVVGVNEEMVGGAGVAVTVNVPVLVAVPMTVVTLM